MVQPPLRGPTRFSALARTFSKKTWQKSDSPLMSLIGEIVTPGTFRSKSMKLMPSCFGTSGSVRTRQKIQSEWLAPVVQIFEPLMT